MKTQFILIILVLNSLASKAQYLGMPAWGGDVHIETAKAKKVISVNPLKYGPEEFKTCVIKITGTDSKLMKASIDISDIFYSKDAELYSVDYKIEVEDNRSYATYIFLKNETMFGLTFYFNDISEKIREISLFFHTDINSKSTQSKRYVLSEIKE